MCTDITMFVLGVSIGFALALGCYMLGLFDEDEIDG